MILISIAYAASAEFQTEVSLRVEESCTVALAIQRSGILKQFPELQLNRMAVGIYSQPVHLDSLLQEGDRIEIYRPLLIDPKQARRAKAKLGN